MKCVLCVETEMKTYEADSGLNAHKCNGCSGMWLTSDAYHFWIRAKGENLPEKAADADFKLASEEITAQRCCPTCGFILLKYRVGKGLDFSLNRCGQCGGIWFDKNEWEILKSRNLHDDVHLIFSQNWQSRIREEEHQQALDQMWQDRFGAADLQELQRIQTWLDEHPKSEELYAFLMMKKHKRAATP